MPTMRHPSTSHANGQASSPLTTHLHGTLAPLQPGHIHLRGNPTPDTQEPAITPPHPHHGQHHLGTPSPLHTSTHRPPQARQPTSTRSRGPPTIKPLTRRTHQKPPHRRRAPNQTPAVPFPTHRPRITVNHRRERAQAVPHPPERTSTPLTPHHRSTKGTPQGLKPNPPGRDHRPPPTTPPTRRLPGHCRYPSLNPTTGPSTQGTTDHRREQAQTAPTSQQPPLPLHSHQNRPHCLQRPHANPTSTRISLLGHHEQGHACMIDIDQFPERSWPRTTSPLHEEHQTHHSPPRQHRTI